LHLKAGQQLGRRSGPVLFLDELAHGLADRIGLNRGLDLAFAVPLISLDERAPVPSERRLGGRNSDLEIRHTGDGWRGRIAVA
jgi:hypothetical protein